MADGVAFAGARFVPEEVLTALRHFFRDLNARPQMLLSEKDLSARSVDDIHCPWLAMRALSRVVVCRTRHARACACAARFIRPPSSRSGSQLMP